MPTCLFGRHKIQNKSYNSVFEFHLIPEIRQLRQSVLRKALKPLGAQTPSSEPTIFEAPRTHLYI